MSRKICYLEVKGSEYERALQQALYFKHEQENLLSSIEKIFHKISWHYRMVPRWVFHLTILYLGRKYLREHREILSHFHNTNFLEKIRGLAEGFEKSETFIYGFNAVEIISSELPFELGCAAVVFSSHATDDAKPKLAYNHDFPEPFSSFLFLRKSQPDSGYASLSLRYPPILGSIGGVNEAGLAISLNHAYATDIKLKKAFLITALVQECLNRCKNVAEAKALIEKTPVPNGSFITLLDAEGNRCVVELSCSAKRFREANSEILHTFNKYQIKEMEQYEIPLEAKGKGHFHGLLVHAHNIGREKRYQKIIDLNKKYTEKDIHDLMSDHNGHDEGDHDSICRHHDKTGNTLCSAIMSPVDRQIKVILGNPCSGDYETFSL